MASRQQMSSFTPSGISFIHMKSQCTASSEEFRPDPNFMILNPFLLTFCLPTWAFCTYLSIYLLWVEIHEKCPYFQSYHSTKKKVITVHNLITFSNVFTNVHLADYLHKPKKIVCLYQDRAICAQ